MEVKEFLEKLKQYCEEAECADCPMHDWRGCLFAYDTPIEWKIDQKIEAIEKILKVVEHD